MKSTLAWTKDKQIIIPEIQHRHIFSSEKAEPLRGYAFTLAIIDEKGNCIGWILKEDLQKCQEKLCNPMIQ